MTGREAEQTLDLQRLMVGGTIQATRLALRSGVVSGERAERDRCVRGPERRRADLGNRTSELSGEYRETEDVAELSLVGTHAERCVTLEMLDGAVAFARGQGDVVDGDVVLKVDEPLVALVARIDTPHRLQRAGREGLRLRTRERRAGR